MSDAECSIEELTAFLEASDDEETADNTAVQDGDDKSPQEQVKQMHHDDDDGCDLDKIAAFLEASDDDDDDDDGGGDKELTGEQSDGEVSKSKGDKDIQEHGYDVNNDQDSKTAVLEGGVEIAQKTSPAGEDHEDDKECDLDEISAFLEASDDDDQDEEVKGEKPDDKVEKSKGDNETEENGCDVNNDQGNEEEMAVTSQDEFEDMEDADFDELDQIMESQSTAKTDTQSTFNGESQSTFHGESQSSGAGDQPEDQLEELVMVTNDAVSPEVTDDEDEEDLAHNAIKVEMAAMAERMQQLQQMLEKKSSPGSKHKQSSPGSKHKQSSPGSKHKHSSPGSKHKHSSSGSKHKHSSPGSKHKHSHKQTHLDIEHKSRSKVDKQKENSSKSISKVRTSKSSVKTSSSAKTSSVRPSNSSVKSSNSSVNPSNSSVKPSNSSVRTPKLSTELPSSSVKATSSSIKTSGSGQNKSHLTKTRDSSLNSCHVEKNEVHKDRYVGKDKEDIRRQEVKQGNFFNKYKRYMRPTSNGDDSFIDLLVSVYKDLHEAQRPSAHEEEERNPFFASTKTSKLPDLNSEPTATRERPASSFYKKTEEPLPVDAKSLFGDSDSDWDELDGDEKTKLSAEGKDMKKLMHTGSKKREAHQPTYDPQILNKSPRSTWAGGRSLPSQTTFQSTFTPKVRQPEQQLKPLLDPETGTVSGKYRVKEEYKTKTTSLPKEDVREIVTDPFCGIRIVNPRISMDEFKQKMSGRQLLGVSRLLSKYGVSDLQKDNWVTMGVVVHKTEPRQSAAGKPYCIWKLSDLQNCEKTITFFLFGNVYKDHWKNDQGVVIGLLNPSLMDKAEKTQSEVAFTINHPQQLLMMGISKDLGWCKGTTKSGQSCKAFINKQQGEFCVYHVQAAYKKTSAKRSELQARPQSKTEDKMTIKKLQSQEARKSAGKITTMSLHELEPEHEMKLQKLKEKDKNLLDLLSVPTAGAMNFVKHLVKKETAPTDEADINDSAVIQSVSAKDLLKEHQKTLQQQKLVQLAAMPKLGKGFSVGQDISLDVPLKKVQSKASVELAKRLAIAKVKAKGGIEKEDPNAVRKKLTSPEAREKIKKRVVDDIVDTETKSSADLECSEPPRKKSKLLGNLDLNSPEVKKLMMTKSKHTGALAEAEAEHEERYFSALEKKERMEEKMDSIKEVPVTLSYCVQCKYTWFTVHDRCKEENHVIKKVKGSKRFFKCKVCKKRTISIDKIPTTSCKNCGSSDFERVSMLKERSGPKLESEQLCIRGNEQKFVGSLGGKTYLNA